ncbi:MAG: N-6 DNA methylase [Nitrospirota bacterium]|nr:N-6 DNA methylase [Nitrospirota bacterium]
MRHFATESGKSKGQFYTPAEVSSGKVERGQTCLLQFDKFFGF